MPAKGQVIRKGLDCWPFQLQVVQVVLLPKSEVKERPISLTSVLGRIWSKLRRSHLALWLEGYCKESGFDSAVLGHTSFELGAGFRPPH